MYIKLLERCKGRDISLRSAAKKIHARNVCVCVCGAVTRQSRRKVKQLLASIMHAHFGGVWQDCVDEDSCIPLMHDI